MPPTELPVVTIIHGGVYMFLQLTLLRVHNETNKINHYQQPLPGVSLYHQPGYPRLSRRGRPETWWSPSGIGNAWWACRLLVGGAHEEAHQSGASQQVGR